jgi:adenylate cyclase
MSDIFISYSRKDSEQALSLAERLRGEGMSVWIDQHGIEGARPWSEEIVKAIESSGTFLLLLSSHSIESDNVVREMSIALESKKSLLPVAIEDVILTPRFKYPLAGIQRVAYTQFGAITEALHSLGISTHEQKTQKRDNRKALLVLPFEDLSPTQDNLWFADGLAGELIHRLSHLRTLKVIDRRTSQALRHSTLSNYDIASTLGVQYVVEGSVRKFGEEVKTSIALLNIKDGDYLWQESHRGLMEDIFDLQELIVEKVMAGMKLHLGADDKPLYDGSLTHDPVAYELYLKAVEEANRHTNDSYHRALRYVMQAIELDDGFARAYDLLASIHLFMHRNYDRSDPHLALAEAAVERIRMLQGESARWHYGKSRWYMGSGDYEQAETFARRSIALDPTLHDAYWTLGYAREKAGDHEGAVRAREDHLKLSETTMTHFALIVALRQLNNAERLQAAAIRAIPSYMDKLKLDPSDESASIEYANVLWFAGRAEEAKEQALRLKDTLSDGRSLYNLACLTCNLKEFSVAIALLRQSIDHGMANVELLKTDVDLQALRDRAEYASQLNALIEKLELRKELQA